MKLAKICIVAFLSMYCGVAFASTPVSTTLSKHDDASWSVTYDMKRPVQRLAFQSAPDQSRASRWTAGSADYAIVHENEVDYVRRVDGKPFSQVTFSLTPTYTHLPKYYAPFSPFSDGGLLVHSGRFFACAEVCEDDLNEWSMKLLVPKGDNIILNGEIKSLSVSWHDSKDGRNVYVGSATPMETDNFISVIDPSLPPEILSMLNDDLPDLVDLYADRLAARNDKAMLFVSYGKTDGDRKGNQGGVLPNQVMMHWYGKVFDDPVDKRKIFWFLSHEIAHLYQRKTNWISGNASEWIHEGTADFMSSLTLLEKLPDSAAYVDTFREDAKTKCIDRLAGESLLAAAKQKKYDVYYSCGFTISQAIQNAAVLRNNKADIFTIWNRYVENVEAGQPVSRKTFLASLRPFVGDEFMEKLDQLTGSEKVDSGAIILELLSAQPVSK